MSASKKGIASTELSRKLSLRQKTCWLFQQKVMKAMASSGNNPLDGNVEVDETVVGGEENFHLFAYALGSAVDRRIGMNGGLVRQQGGYASQYTAGTNV